MRNQPIRLGTLTIASAGTDSPSLDLKRKPVVAITVYAPATLTGTITIQVSHDDSTWATHPVTAGLAASTVVVIEPIAFSYLRIHSNAAEGGNRDFVLEAAEDIL